MAKLNLETFNEILFGALKDDSPEGKLEMIKAELQIVQNIMFDMIGDLLDELHDSGYQGETFLKIENLKSNTECLIEQMEELEKQINGGGSDD